MKAAELKKRYIAFFQSKGHAPIPSAPLVPENDPTVLFTTAGMHPLVPFLLGQPHPLGKRLVDVQKCIRTQDINEVGDETHTTFFEMLGNWSLGDYFKKEAIAWSFEFLTKELKIPLNRLAFTCFAGDADAPKDDEAAQIWMSQGVTASRIAFLPKSDNWWGPAGTTGPCGPDTEMFYWKENDVVPPAVFDPKDKRWVEIWNDVFMQYEKTKDGTYIPLAQKNVDTGMGVERVTMALQGKTNVFETELFLPIFEQIEKMSGKKPQDAIESYRVIADHLRASTFILGDERTVKPSNVDQGYILRRFIRRAVRHARLLGIEGDVCVPIAKVIIDMYKSEYPLLASKQSFIEMEFVAEESRFSATLEKGLQQIFKYEQSQFIQKMGGYSKIKTDYPQFIVNGKIAVSWDKSLVGATLTVDAQWLFDLYQSHGIPYELALEELENDGKTVENKGAVLSEVATLYQVHQEKSRAGAMQKFKGGLADTSNVTVRLHTATHLLNEALRKVVDSSIVQKGSNITPDRLRFDFNFSRKLTDDEIKRVETEVNRVIAAGLVVTRDEMSPDEAKARGAQAEFGARYPSKVSVYRVGDYSTEICMGPHVENTKDIGTFKIVKEEAVAAGIRRIKAVVE